MQLFEYAIIYTPKERYAGNGKSTTTDKPLLLAFEKLIAKDQAEAQILVARQIPEKYLAKLSEVQIAVRPF